MKSSIATTTSANQTNSPSSHFSAFLETGLRAGYRMTVKEMAARLGYSIPALRKALVGHYGSNISFTKGRTGGIIIAPAYMLSLRVASSEVPIPSAGC